MCPKINHLTPREAQIADLIQQGKSNKIIAFELGLTTGTIKEYLSHIFKKLGFTNRTELAMWNRDKKEPVNENAIDSGSTGDWH